MRILKALLLPLLLIASLIGFDGLSQAGTADGPVQAGIDPVHAHKSTLHLWDERR